jgi:c-di-GMP phosphodiesterase
MLKNPNLFEHFYVARQPIFDNTGQIWGYELLFRSGPNKQSSEITNQEIATLSVATCGFALAQGYCDQTKKICINFTEKLILQGAPHGLPPTVTVVEVLEDIQPTQEVYEKLIELKQAGYLIAIDDYVGNTNQKELLSIADIIKIDILSKTTREIENIFQSLHNNKSLRLAEKVENREILEHLRTLGCHLYQGYFFAKPTNLRGRKLKPIESSKLRVLRAIEDANANEDTIKELIMSDPTIAYRLLRMLNSAAFGFSVRIGSVPHAMRLIGFKRLKYWLRMVVMSDLISKKKSNELYIMALNRGRILEELAHQIPKMPSDPDTMFLFGMLSLLDVMFDMPMKDLIDEMPLPEELKSGYLDSRSLLWRYLQLIIALENADSTSIKGICQDIGVDEKDVAIASNRSIAWTSAMYGSD